MPVAMLLLSVITAAIGGAIVWSTAGFWWALAAYSGIGSTTILLLGALQAFQSSGQAGTTQHFVKAEIAG